MLTQAKWRPAPRFSHRAKTLSPCSVPMQSPASFSPSLRFTGRGLARLSPVLSPIKNRKSKIENGFTLIELLVVIAINMILATMLLPALTKAKLRAQGIQCMSNHKNLALAWRMYSDDNHDVLVFASDAPGFPNDLVMREYAWTWSKMSFLPDPMNWDINADIVKRPLWPY